MVNLLLPIKVIMIECCFYTHAHYILTYRCDTQITSFVFPSGDDLRKYGVPPSGPAGEEKSFIVLSGMYLIHGLGGRGGETHYFGLPRPPVPLLPWNVRE